MALGFVQTGLGLPTLIAHENTETATMDETTSPIPAELVADAARPDRRRRAREILSQQTSRLDRLEGELSQRLQQLTDEIAREMAAEGGQSAALVEAAHDARLTSLGAQIDQLRGDIAGREESLKRVTDELEQARIERGSLEQELRIQQALATEASARSEEARLQIASLGAQLADLQAQLTVACQRQDELRQQTQTQQQAWEQEREQLDAERRRETREFKSLKAEQADHLAAIALLEESLTQAQREQERLVAELRESAGPRADDAEELHTLRQERDALGQRLNSAQQKLAEYECLTEELDTAQTALDKLTKQSHSKDAIVAQLQDEVERQNAESAAARLKLGEAQTQLAAAQEQLADVTKLTMELEQERIKASRLEQEVRVRDALVADWQSRDEQTQLDVANARRELAAQSEQARDELAKLERELQKREKAITELQADEERSQAELAAARDTHDELRKQNAELVKECKALEAGAEISASPVELQQAQARIESLERELAARGDELAEAQLKEEKRRAELATNVEQVAELQAQLAGVQAQLAAATQRSALVDKTAAELEVVRIESGKQQQELRVQEALLAEAQQQQQQNRVELASVREQLVGAEAQLAIARQRQEELRQEAAAAQDAAAASATADQNQEVARLREALKVAHAESEQLAAQLKDAPAPGDSDELKKLRKERDSLRRKLTETEDKLAESAQGQQGGQDQEDLKKRLEMAIDELRETKRANAELETKLKSKSTGAVAVGGVGGGALDWEAQKQRLLASLEADEIDETDEDAVEERQSIESTIEMTDRVLAEKDAEIEELRRQLESNASNGIASATAVAELLDSDEIVRAEREKLAQAQAEWREKIGKAEIDISMERAKIARERMELEEKMRHYQHERPDDSTDATSEKTGKPVRGRWLSRLGLKDLNDE